MARMGYDSTRAALIYQHSSTEGQANRLTEATDA
jgi:hypothetical protein